MNDMYKLLLKNINLLLVEDDLDLRAHFKDVLSLYVDNIYEASNGKEALELFKKESINIIYSDINMPIVNGLELSAEIRKIDPNIPIVIISAHSEQEVLLEFMKLHLVEYIIKPVKYAKLLESLEYCAKVLDDKSLLNFRLANGCSYNKNQKMLMGVNQSISLTTKEILFLELLIKNNAKLVSKDLIEYTLYEDKIMTDSALKNLVLKLRKKLCADVIKTVGSNGYMLVCQ